MEEGEIHGQELEQEETATSLVREKEEFGLQGYSLRKKSK